jgi:hypothetical protein
MLWIRAHITLGSSLREIGTFAFSDNSTVKPLLIPASVESIGEWCLSWCSGVTDLTFESDLRSTLIGDHADQRCSSLRSIWVSFPNRACIWRLPALFVYSLFQGKLMLCPLVDSSVANHSVSCDLRVRQVWNSSICPSLSLNHFWFRIVSNLLVATLGFSRLKVASYISGENQSWLELIWRSFAVLGSPSERANPTIMFLFVSRKKYCGDFEASLKHHDRTRRIRLKGNSIWQAGPDNSELFELLQQMNIISFTSIGWR